MRNIFLAAAVLLAGSITQAKINTSISGEEALQFALADAKVQAQIEKVEGALVEVYLSEPDYEGGLSQYEHIVELKYLLKEPGYCMVTAVLGLDVKTRQTPPKITYSEPALRSVKTICQK